MLSGSFKIGAKSIWKVLDRLTFHFLTRPSALVFGGRSTGIEVEVVVKLWS